MSQLASPYHNTFQSDAKSTNKKSNNKQELLSKSKLKETHPPEITDIISDTNLPENIAETVIQDEKIEQATNPSLQDKSVAKLTKRQSLRVKQSALRSQKQKEMEKDQANSAAFKAVEASGRQIKTGNNKIESNIRQYSAQHQREDPPQPEDKKVTTESKKTKNATSTIKNKTEVKEIKEVKEEPEKISILGAAKRSSRKSGQLNETVPETRSSEKNVQSKSKSSKRKQPKDEQPKPQSVIEHKKSSRKVEQVREAKEEKEEEKGNKMTAMKKDGTSSKKLINFAGEQKSKAKGAATRSAIKSVAKSGVKKVKLQSAQKYEK